MAYPYGLVGTPTQSLIVVDVFGIILEGCNCHEILLFNVKMEVFSAM